MSWARPVDFRTYPGVTHDRITFASRADVLAWIKARFAGKPCPTMSAAALSPPAVARRAT